MSEIENYLKFAVLRLGVEVATSQIGVVTRLKNNPDFFPAPNPDMILRELSVRVAIDEGCREWVEKFQWPLVESEETVLLVAERVIQAHWFGSYLFQNGFYICEKEENETLVWLLVDFWRDAGCQFWKRGIHGPNCQLQI